MEIHVPISPTPLFFNRIHYLAASLAEYGGPLAKARIVVTIGDSAGSGDCPSRSPAELAAALPWCLEYPVEWRRVPDDLHRRYSYWATRLHRFTYDFEAPTVLILDADVLVVGRFDELVGDVIATQCVHGVPAQVTPLRGDRTWEETFGAAGLGDVPYAFEHLMYGITNHDPAKRYCPAYYNLGAVAMPAAHARTIGRSIYSELEIVWPLEDFFRAQTALALSIHRNDIPFVQMPLRYHIPNDPRLVSRYPAEFADMRIVHYLRKEQIDKDADFETPAAVGRLLARRDLDAANRTFVDRLRPVHERVLHDLAAAGKA